MIRGPRKLWEKYDRWLAAENVPRNQHGEYRKWLRFYLDFCTKYDHEYANPASLGPFVEKLVAKRQAAGQREQAKRAVALYYRMTSEHGAGSTEYGAEETARKSRENAEGELKKTGRGVEARGAEGTCPGGGRGARSPERGGRGEIREDAAE